MSLSAGGAPSPLEAIGAWDDGVSRRITALAGTEFVSSDATVAQVDVSGRVTPVSPGFATVTVRNGGASSDVPVAVLGPPAPACAPCPRVVPAR